MGVIYRSGKDSRRLYHSLIHILILPPDVQGSDLAFGFHLGRNEIPLAGENREPSLTPDSPDPLITT